MRIRAPTAGIAISGIAASLLVSCGGGGGYGGSNSMLMPMVMFTSPMQASTISFGQAVKLGWTSSYVTSCALTASSKMGGAFTGTQPLSGEVSVAPTGSGSVTYTLTCTGSGGMVAAISPTVTVQPSILGVLATTKIATIGSTIDPSEKGGNPYGLAIAPTTAGLITAGDLVVCNFNDGNTNTQGLGTTIVGLHPTAGAVPYRIAQSPSLQGCNAVAVLPSGSISAAAYLANQDPLVSAAGVVGTPFASDSFASPWGQAYVAGSGGHGAAIYAADVGGSIDRIDLNGDVQSSFTQIASGFCGSGQPGAVFAPAGLTYDASIDTLYIVDTSSNSVVAFANVSSIGAAGVAVNGQCKSVAAPPTPVPTFGGPSASSARVIAHGSPLIAPISAALLADGDLIVGNGDINIAVGQMPNLAVEVSPALPGGFVGEPMQLDASGTPGALFGIVATVDSQGSQIVYFNDDNTNTVMMLATPAPSAGGMPYSSR
jgi:hypothetical protein